MENKSQEKDLVTGIKLHKQRESESPAAKKPQKFAPQKQNKPGHEVEMLPHPIVDDPDYRSSDKLRDKVAIITGGDSGIGKATAIAFAKEGADICIVYLNEYDDAYDAKMLIEEKGRRCLLIKGDVGDESFCKKAVSETAEEFGKLDILINNAAEQTVLEGISDLTSEQLERTFRTNIFGYIYMAKAALEFMEEGATIINTTSIQAYKPSPSLLDYACTKGAIVTFTKALSDELAPKGIRVNAVAPGPIWTPLIPSTFPEERTEEFGSDTPLKRAGQPFELAPTFVYLASKQDSSYVTGEVIMVTGGKQGAG